MRVLTQGQRPRKQYTLSGFKGVDYSSSPLDVAKYRAAKMQNFLLEDGTLHKRKGWEQAAQFDGQINGLWPFDDGDKQCVIVHAGTDIYAWDSASGTKTKLTGDISTIADRRSYAVYKNKKLYILCGDYLAYGHFSDSDDGAYELRTVAGDTDTYVPTTSIKNNDTGAVITQDNVNLINTMRYNEFTSKEGNRYVTDALLCTADTGYIPRGAVSFEVTVPDGGTVQTIVYSNKFENGQWTDTLKSDDANGATYRIYYETGTIGAFDGKLKFAYDLETCASTDDWTDIKKELGQLNAYSASIPSSNPQEYLQLTKGEFSLKLNELIPLMGRVGGYVVVCKMTYNKRISDGWEQHIYLICAAHDYNTPYAYILYEEEENDDGEIQYVPYIRGIEAFTVGENGALYLKRETKDGANGIDFTVGSYRTEYYDTRNVYLKPRNSRSQIANCRTGCLFGVDGRNDRLFIGGNPDFPNVCYNTAKNDFTYFPDQQTSTCGEETSEISGFCRLGDGTLAVLKNTRDNNDVSVYYITGSSVSMAEGEEGNTLTYDEFFVKAGSIGESCITAHGTANLSGDPLMVSENGVYGIVLSGNVATDERYARERSRSVNTELLKHDLSDACGIAYKNRYYLAVDGECFVADARYKYTLDADMDDTYNYEWFHYKNIPARVWNVLDGELWFGSDTGGVYRMDSGGWADISRTWAEPGTDGTLTVANGVFTYSEDLAAAVESATYVLADGVKANITAGEAAQTFTLTAAETDAAILTAAALVFVTETPVSAAWYSGILDLGTPLYRKNLWLLSIGLRPMSGAEVQFGYRIRRGKNLSDAVADIVGGEANAYGAETFDFGDVDFKRFSFEANGFMSQYTKRVFERDFVYMQLYFRSDSASDCVITDITAVFTEVRKNLGVG